MYENQYDAEEVKEYICYFSMIEKKKNFNWYSEGNILYISCF